MGIFRKQNAYWIDYRIEGRRRREKISPSKTLALSVLRKRKVGIAEGRFLDKRKEHKIKFKDFAHQYFNLHSKPNKKSWHSSDENSLKRLVPFFGSKYLYEIKPLMVEKYKMERRESVSEASVNRELACLKAMFNKAIGWGKADSNPAKKVEFYKENNNRLRYLEREEISKLLDVCSEPLREILILAINTGMRKGEIMSLKLT